MKKLKPPIFFKQKSEFQAQLMNWKKAHLKEVMEKVTELEILCKQTGAPTETLCAQALLFITAKAAR
jgi:DNA polymerase-3 subunit delta